jgi:hypothetical protein
LYARAIIPAPDIPESWQEVEDRVFPLSSINRIAPSGRKRTSD